MGMQSSAGSRIESNICCVLSILMGMMECCRAMAFWAYEIGTLGFCVASRHRRYP